MPSVIMNKVNLTLVSTKQESEDSISFLFKPQTPISWQAGQFLHYTLEHPNPDNRKNDRYFTIASAPNEGSVMLTTRFSKEKGSSFKNALQNLNIGEQIKAEPPDGDFVAEDPNQQLVFIAGGIGITPFRAILKDFNYKNLPINIILLYANRTEDFVYKKELDELAEKHPNLKIYYFVNPQLINEQTIKRATPDLKPVFYVSGPAPMVKSFVSMLAEMGISDHNIKRDFFPGYSWP